jgi:hypothetical protein
LLLFFVEQRGRTLQRVEVVLEEAFLLELRRRRRRGRGFGGTPVLAFGRLRRAHALDVAGDELERRVFVAGAAVVRERNPTGEITGLVAVVDDHHVVGDPVQVLGQVADLDALLRPAASEQPDQRGLRD